MKSEPAGRFLAGNLDARLRATAEPSVELPSPRERPEEPMVCGPSAKRAGGSSDRKMRIAATGAAGVPWAS